MRGKVVAGNWKMHHGPSECRDFFRRFAPRLTGEAPTLLIFPPALSLAAALETRPSTPKVLLGVQNVHWEARGAFTGEVAAAMAADAGATHVLVGHSERRHVFGETDEEVGRKVRSVRAAGLTPVVCVGETLEERRAGRVGDVIVRQLDAALHGLGSWAGFLLAYEPVWAIGTGETATPADASGAHATLRERLRAALGEEEATRIPILYGGSVNPDNAAELMAAPEVGGVLVGGASLDPESFALIAEAA